MATQIKYRNIAVNEECDIEGRVNEELKGWKITKIIKLEIFYIAVADYWKIILIGEVGKNE